MALLTLETIETTVWRTGEFIYVLVPTTHSQWTSGSFIWNGIFLPEHLRTLARTVWLSREKERYKTSNGTWMTKPEMRSIPLGWSIDSEGRCSREQERVRHFAPDEAVGDVRDKRGDGCHNGSILLRNLSEGDVSSEEFQPLPAIIKWTFCLALMDRFLATSSLFSLSEPAHTRACYNSAIFGGTRADQEAVAKGTRCDSQWDRSLDSFCAQMTEYRVPSGGKKSHVLDLKIPDLCLKA